MWKQNLTKDDRFETGASQVCGKVFEDVSITYLSKSIRRHLPIRSRCNCHTFCQNLGNQVYIKVYRDCFYRSDYGKHVCFETIKTFKAELIPLLSSVLANPFET